MEREITFPNPIDRLDLPKKRNRWPKVIAALVILFLLGTILLPQILGTGIGRTLFISLIERRTHMRVFCDDIQTSWFGGTSVRNFWITDDKGPRIGASFIKTDLSLLNLLREKYNLGDASADGLLIDYVVNYGDGSDLFRRLAPPPPPKPNQPPAKRIPMNWIASGHLKITNGTIVLTRGQLSPTYHLSFNQSKFTSVSGNVDVNSLTQPWTIALHGTAGSSGSADFSAQITLNNSMFVVPGASATFNLQMSRVPTAPLAWVICQSLEPADYVSMLGAEVKSAVAVARLTDGKLVFDTLNIVGQTFGDKNMSIEGKPVIDVASDEAELSNGTTPITALVHLGPGIGKNFLTFVDPFLSDVENGIASITIDQATLPLDRSPGSVSGHVAITAGVLTGAHDWFDQVPTTITGQWQTITGDGNAKPNFTMPSTEFTAGGGESDSKPHDVLIDGIPAKVGGTVSADGKMNMAVAITLPPAISSQLPNFKGPLLAEIKGNYEKPKIEIETALKSIPDADAAKLAELIGTNGAAQHTQYIQRESLLGEKATNRASAILGTTLPSK